MVRHLRPLPVVIAGHFCSAAGAAACAAATTYPVFLVGRAFAGAGHGPSVVALYVIIGRFYPSGLRPTVFTYVSAAWVLPRCSGRRSPGMADRVVLLAVGLGIVCVPAVAAAAVVASRARSVEMAYADPAPTTPDGRGGRARRRADRLDADAGVDPAGRAAHLRTAAIGIGVAAAAGVVQYGSARSYAPPSPRPARRSSSGWSPSCSRRRVLTPGTLTMRRGLASVMTARLLLMAAFNGVVSFVPLMLTAERGASPAHRRGDPHRRIAGLVRRRLGAGRSR